MSRFYNPSPVIVPLVTALVYDVSKHNALGATTLTLPVFYTRDRISPDTDAVSKAGQTAVFDGGPGFNDASATVLQLKNSTAVAAQGHVFTTFNFDKAKVVTTSKVGSKVETGIAELTYTSPMPSSVFANQQFLGFYRDNTWTKCLGIPIWDYGTENAKFTATLGDPVTPVTIFDSTTPFLNGGSLENVVRKMRAATYLYSWDVLDAMVQWATTSQDDRGIGLAATAAALKFAVSAASANAPIVDRIDVPIVATVTTTPAQAVGVAPVAGDGPVADVGNRALASNAIIRLQQIIGEGGNAPKTANPGPVTIQVGLSASIPREALDGTGITSIESGTVLSEQPLGAGDAFKALAAGTAINLKERHNVDPAFAPYDLPVANLGVTFRAAVSYVLSLTVSTLTVRGSDGSTAAVEAKPRDTTHTFVGMMVYAVSTTSVRLYPKLSLPLQLPAVGTQGVLQRETYNIRFTFGGKTSTYDLLDSNQVPIARQVSMPSPKPTDGSSPRPGDVYFGSFTGGDTKMSVWNLPIFLTVGPKDLPGASFDGSMILDAEVSGVPAYSLQVTGGNIYPMTAGNTQFLLNGVQYTIALKAGSLNGATISGQFNITQGNVVVIENFVYEIDMLNGQLVMSGAPSNANEHYPDAAPPASTRAGLGLPPTAWSQLRRSGARLDSQSRGPRRSGITLLHLRQGCGLNPQPIIFDWCFQKSSLQTAGGLDAHSYLQRQR
jgi:hypothetical protein